MRNRTIVLAIGLVLTVIAPVLFPHLAFAQGCTDATGRPVECPPAADQEGHKKKPSPTRPRDYKTDTPTPTSPSTPTVISGVTLTPTKVPVMPIIPGGDGAGDSAGGWPFSFGSDTTRMLFDGDARNGFSSIAGLLGFLIAGVIGFMGIQFLLKRADRINYDVPDDTTFIFEKHRPEGGPMPLLTEIGFPDTDSHAKVSPYLEDPQTPGASDVNPDALAEIIEGSGEGAKPHVVPASSVPSQYQADAAGPVEPEHPNFYEEERARRGSASPAPKKFPDPGDHQGRSENTERGSDDD